MPREKGKVACRRETQNETVTESYSFSLSPEPLSLGSTSPLKRASSTTHHIFVTHTAFFVFKGGIISLR